MAHTTGGSVFFCESSLLRINQRHHIFNTVKTRRDRLKQPKFVLRCVQLMVGLPCPIGLKAIQRVPKTSPARATARSGIWTSPVSSPYQNLDDSRLFALHLVRRITSASSDASSTGNVCTTPSTGASVRTTSPPGLCCDRYALKAAPCASSSSYEAPCAALRTLPAAAQSTCPLHRPL